MNAFINFLPNAFWIVIAVVSACALIVILIAMAENNCSCKQIVPVGSSIMLVGLFSLVMAFKAPNIEQFNTKPIQPQQLSKDIKTYIDSIVESKVNQRLKELSTNYKYHILAESK
jgi:hypothetical protein